MTNLPTSWIQSLLLISGRRLPVSDILVTELRHRIGSSQFDNTPSDSKLPEEECSGSYSIKTIRSISSAQRGSGDLTREGPFWVDSIQPRRVLMEVLGNGVLIRSLPTSISCVIVATICGQGATEFSWEFYGPERLNVSPALLFVSRPKIIQWRSPFGIFPTERVTTSRQIAHIRESTHLPIAEEGEYSIIAKLDGIEANRLPLSVQVAS